MTRVLNSYLSGQWCAGSGEGSPLFDPTTEEVLAKAETAGLDFRGALEFARDKGGAALRELNFGQRGALLSAMAKSLHAHRDELLELSTRSGGNTRGDAKFDIDGATGTLAYYGKLARQLGDATFFLEEGVEQLAANPRYIGCHVKVPRHGVAVHINAFNFPAWGFGEKAALALLAGMPVVTKPATSTAIVTERMIQILVDDQVLPDGALSLVAGRPGDLLDHLGPQDVLAFTGSSDTGTWIRTRENLVRNGVRINVEADSLNAAVLGPDIDRDAAAYDLFLRETARDMTQKAGQKCTAIRRIFVPNDLLEGVRDDLVEEIKRVKVGNPAQQGVRMGPLATASQLKDVREGIARLAQRARFIHGDGGRGDLEGVDDGKGYFVGPTLLEAEGIHDDCVVHALEVFGPVQTLIPYSGTASEAVHGVSLGQGGLVASIYTDDKRFASEVALGLAPYNGRLHIGSSKVADHSPGPGTVLPQMIHGGPGRAGGGEELGGLRGLDFYLQRTAIQGLKTLVEKMTGTGTH
ncbi:MAG TPA: 3,4-dehydroadipyl-CoA semialdehyde dehydrogenase [Deltaproteobacteria bacterium]|nr:aldehyde dehydrogenase [Deltaproteobacteria bacterium]HCP46130.1 3,4-dehydroadipyl-CoA semialdehyde dehydrogenase [Deltaproteobacteria bacterium]